MTTKGTKEIREFCRARCFTLWLLHGVLHCVLHSVLHSVPDGVPDGVLHGGPLFGCVSLPGHSLPSCLGFEQFCVEGNEAILQVKRARPSLSAVDAEPVRREFLRLEDGLNARLR